jgi:hypothetical protein
LCLKPKKVINNGAPSDILKERFKTIQTMTLYVNASGGTSYAPYVSGMAALVFSKNQSLAARAVKIIVGTAESVGCISAALHHARLWICG